MMDIIKGIKEIEKLSKGNGKWGIEAQEVVELLCIIIRDKIKYEQLYEMMSSLCQHLPNPLILQIAEICDRDVCDIEYEWEAEGFNDWYQKNYGKTVKEASR